MTVVSLTTVAADDPSLSETLRNAALPADDVREPGRLFFQIEHAGEEVGFGGLEVHGDVALLRSLVLHPANRGRGLGGAATAALVKEAGARGAIEVYLLTTDAAPFFKRQGFREVAREVAPDAIKNSRQAAQLCPASATLMTRSVPPEANA